MYFIEVDEKLFDKYYVSHEEEGIILSEVYEVHDKHFIFRMHINIDQQVFLTLTHEILKRAIFEVYMSRIEEIKIKNSTVFFVKHSQNEPVLAVILKPYISLKLKI